MLKALRLFQFSLVLGVSSPVWSACNEPEPPPIPDPSSAVLAEMVKAQKDVKKFIAEGEAFLKCAKSQRKQNKVAELMQETGNEFNSAIKRFKALKQE